ncbi:hypothetical protein BC828DRAFT_383353 [Blastocladiella britannica]|nr:hypothetical protein BC828DRAFT_383353 [Blastocladiella britannica]
MTIESRTERMNRASSEMGRLLLSGWTMLNETCPTPTCGCVLMQSRVPPIRKLCPLCGDPSVAAASSAAPVPVLAPTLVSLRPATVDSALAADTFSSSALDHASSASAPPHRRRFDRNSDEDSDSDMEIDANDLAAETARQRARLMAAHGPRGVAPPSRDAAPEPSALLGQRMLQGWTMLAETCPRCISVPLMKHQDTIECVVCGIPGSTSPVVAAEVAPAPAPVNVHATSSTPRSLADAPVIALAGVAPSPIMTHAPTSIAEIADRLLSGSSTSGNSGISSFVQLVPVVDSKLAHLSRKLNEAQHPEDISRVVAVVRELVALRKDLA